MHQQHPAAADNFALQELAHARQIGVVPIIGDFGQHDQVELILGRLCGKR